METTLKPAYRVTPLDGSSVKIRYWGRRSTPGARTALGAAVVPLLLFVLGPLWLLVTALLSGAGMGVGAAALVGAGLTALAPALLVKFIVSRPGSLVVGPDGIAVGRLRLAWADLTGVYILIDDGAAVVMAEACGRSVPLTGRLESTLAQALLGEIRRRCPPASPASRNR